MTLGPKQLRKAVAAMKRGSTSDVLAHAAIAFVCAYALKGAAYYPMDEWKLVAS